MSYHSKENSKRTRRIAVCAMIIAIGVVIISLGSLVEVLDLCTAALASFLTVLVGIEYGHGNTLADYAATAVLALLLAPQKSPAMVYAAFGFYPIVKEKLERLPRGLAAILKCVIFVVLEVLLIHVADLLTGADELLGPLYYVALYALGFVTLWLLDVALTRMITLYLRKYRERIRRLF